MRGTLTKPAESPISAPPGKASFGTDCQPPSTDRPRAVGDALAALQHVGDQRVVLEALELHVGVEPGVLVVQVDDEADVDLIVLEMVHERPAAGVAAERPTHGVGDLAELVVLRADLPELLHAEAVLLRLAALREPVFRDELLREAAADALADQDVFAPELHAGLVGRTGLAVLVEAELAGDDASDAVAVEDERGGGHAGEDLDAQGLGLLGHPPADVAHRDDVVAVVRHELRHRPVRDSHLRGPTKQVEAVLGHRRRQRSALLPPVRDQGVETARVEHGAREDMGADLGALLEHDDRAIGVELLQPDCRGEAGGAGADDDNVVLHRLAFDVGHGWLLR